MLCIKCDKEIPDGSLFCNYCGKKQQPTAAPPKKRNRRANGTGSIKKLSGRRAKPYAAAIMQNNHSVFLGTFATYFEASRFLQELDKENISSRLNWTLGQFYNLWTDTPHYKKLSKSARQAYQAAWSRLSALSGEKMRNLKTSDYQKIIDTAIKKKRYKLRTEAELSRMSDKEQQHYYALVAQPDEPLGYDGKKDIKELAGILCQMAMKDDVINKNYAEMIELETNPAKTEKINFTAEQIALLFDNDNKPAARISLIYLYTGMRANELLTLKKENVSIADRIIIAGSKTAAGRNRTIPIHPHILKYIEDMMTTPSEYLISKNGKPVSYEYFTRYMFYPLLDELGIARQNENGENIITLHRTRHTWVQMAIESGMPPEAVQKIAGHAKYETSVNKYGDKISTEYLKDAMDKL